jgi:ABC-type Fe3+/spermidine/putrescine transport system ATPase subunit
MENHHKLRRLIALSNLLTVSEITKIYESGKRKVVGVKNINFCVNKGHFISIIGPSGCGKSTLLRCIAGFEKTNNGKISLNGRPVTKPGPDRFMIFSGVGSAFSMAYS